jgi:hypothetical protein
MQRMDRHPAIPVFGFPDGKRDRFLEQDSSEILEVVGQFHVGLPKQQILK